MRCISLSRELGKHSKRYSRGLVIVSQLMVSKSNLPLDWDEDIFFAYVLVQGSCFAVSFYLSSSLSHLQCCLLVFSHVGLSLVYCTQNSGQLKSIMNIYHVFYIGGVYRPKKIDIWCQTLSQSLHRGCGLGTRLFFYSCHSYIVIYYLSRFVFFNENVNFGDTCSYLWPSYSL